MFPDACIVYTRRDPAKAIPSMCSLYEVNRSIGTNNPIPHETGQMVLQRYHLAKERLKAAKSLVDSGQIFEVGYEELVRAPMGMVARIHEHFGLPLTAEHERAMIEWFPKNPYDPKKVGRHIYSAKDFGLDEIALRRLPA